MKELVETIQQMIDHSIGVERSRIANVIRKTVIIREIIDGAQDAHEMLMKIADEIDPQH
jgi:hypothetical protein